MTSNSTARLRADLKAWKEVEASCPGIACDPLDDNLFEWHGNIAALQGHYRGMVLHVVLAFPQSYPTDPPKVRLCTYIPHSNIIPGSNMLCIDMLHAFGGGWSRPHEGWSSAYSVTSVLLQLQVFLFDEWVDQGMGGGNAKGQKNTLWTRVLEEGSGTRTREEVDRKLKEARESAAKFTCRCGHHGSAAPWPPVAVPATLPPWKCSSVSCHLCADVVLPVCPAAPRPPPSEVSTVATTTLSTAAPTWASGRVVAVRGAWAEVETLGLLEQDAQAVEGLKRWKLWAWRPRAAKGLLLHGYRRGEELDLRVDLRAAARSGAFVPGVVERKEPFGLFVRVGSRVGLAHRSELPWPWPAVDTAVAVRVLTVGDRVSLSLRAFARLPVPEPQRASAKPPLPLVALATVLSFAELGPLRRCLDVSRTFRSLAEEALAARWSGYAMTCFHSKATSADGAVLGVGVRAERSAALEAVFEPVALAAFEAGVRQGVWKNRFNKLLPLAVDREHFARALPAIVERLPQLLVREAHGPHGIRPPSALERASAGHDDKLRQGENQLRRDLQAAKDSADAAVEAEDREVRTLERREQMTAVACTNMRDILRCTTYTEHRENGELEVIVPKHIRSALWDLHYSHAKKSELPLARDTKLVLRNFDMAVPKDLAELKPAAAELGEWHEWIRGELQAARDALAGKKQAQHATCAAAQAALRTAWDAKKKALEAAWVKERARLKDAEAREQAAARKQGGKGSFADQVLQVLPALMNDQVVQLMNGSVWTSAKALEGYMAFHHLFLALAQEFPAVRKEADARAQRFLKSAYARHKRACPNLGELLCVLSVTDCAWEDVAAPLLEEAFDRNVLWALKAHPNLAGDAVDEERIRLSFAANLVSLKLLSFQAWFLKRVARPAGQAPEAILARYHRTQGVPPAKLVDGLQAHCKALAGMSSHRDFCALTGLHALPEPHLAELLRQCRVNSEAKRYHNPKQFNAPAPRATESA